MSVAGLVSTLLGSGTVYGWTLQVAEDVLEASASRAVGVRRGDIMFLLFKFAFREQPMQEELSALQYTEDTSADVRTAGTHMQAILDHNVSHSHPSLFWAA